MILEEIQQFLDECAKKSDVAVINLDTGELLSWDYCQCRERGIPEGYKMINGMSTADWVFLFKETKL